MLIPYGDKVLVEVVKSEEVTSGGIIIPDASKEEKSEGIVVSVGTGKMLADGTIVRVRVSEGDTIVFGKYAGDEIEFDGKKYRIIKESEILAYHRKGGN